MNLPQLLLDALRAELKRVLPDHTVEVREPAEGELMASDKVRQVFLTTEGFQVPEGEQVASQGESAVLLLPVMAALVMPRPGSVLFAAQTLRRRQVFLRAVMRVMRDFGHLHTEANLALVEEQPTLIEGYYVSITGITLTFDLETEGEL